MIPHRPDEPQVHVCANESWAGLVTVAIGTQASYNITPERAEELAAELVDGLNGVDSPVQPLYKLVRGRQMLRNLAGVERIVHSKLLTLHGPLTRYVTGALLTSRRWLHRKAGIRQVSVPRGLSDATPTGGDAA